MSMKYTHTVTDLVIENEYPKLVRDKIPNIIAENEGKKAITRILSDDKEYLKYLLRKLIEETTELSMSETEDNSIEELADIMEVFEAILDLKGLTLNDIIDAQNQKRQKRGGVQRTIINDFKTMTIVDAVMPTLCHASHAGI